MKPKNPFVLNGYVGAEYFCDRVKETNDLIRLLINGNNVVLTSHRRIGKTDLIQHLFAQKEIKDEFITIYVDAYSTNNLSEFISTFAKGVTDSLKPKGKAAIDTFIAMLTSLRSEISFDINGMPVWGFGLGPGIIPEATLDEIFNYLNSSKTPCLVAIDEFQQITNFPNGNQIEALLRSYAQRSPFTRFIFAGSHRHLMAEMFLSPSRPFFQSSTLYGLPILDKEVYINFCIEQFQNNCKSLAKSTAEAVYDQFGGITLYMHKVMNELYNGTLPGVTCQPDEIPSAIDRILAMGHEGYTTIFYQLSERQRELVLAIAQEINANEITSSSFIRKHKLKSQSTVSATAKQLLEKDIITRDKSTYAIYDHFLCLWIRSKILKI